MFGRKARVKCFNATYSAGSHAGRVDLGYQIVPVAQIVGSVGRCEELDRQFRPLHMTRGRRQRLEQIRRLVDQGAILPPVQLYKIKDEYFVLDGNHRVAVAKDNGQAFIDADVVEFLSNGERAEDRLYLEQREFALETGLDSIRLGQPGGYARLRREIEAHRQAWSREAGEPLTLRQAAQRWHREVFPQAVRAIAARRLPERLPQRTIGDLYLDLATRRALAQQQEPREITWDEAAARLATLYPLPTWRERLAGLWHHTIGRLATWWKGLPADEPPCDFALQGTSGAVYCRRVGRVRRGIFQP